jgi:PqqD family protein of HPr-rel-A system
MPKWVPLGVDRALIRVWDDAAVAFNRLSGQTHLLNPLAAEALFLISEQAMSTDELARTLVDVIGEEPSAEWRSQLDEFVAELAELGLIAEASE